MRRTETTSAREEAGSSDPTECFYYLISRASLVATAVLRKALADAGAGSVRPAYLGALMTLWEEDGLNAAELGRRSGLEPSTMTGLLDRMERDGLLERRPDPDDRRAQRIHLTPEGARCRKPVLGVVQDTLDRASQEFTERELAQTKDVLRRFLAVMQKERRA